MAAEQTTTKDSQGRRAMTGETNGKWFSRTVTVAVILAMLAACVMLLTQGDGLAFAEAGTP